MREEERKKKEKKRKVKKRNDEKIYERNEVWNEKSTIGLEEKQNTKYILIIKNKK